MEIIREIAVGSMTVTLWITGLLVAVMVGVEVVKDARILDRISGKIGPGMRIFGLPPEGAMPLLAGVFLGITYGSGVILSASGNGDLNRAEVLRLAVFLAVCHGVVEDTLIFAAIGAEGGVLVGARLALGALFLLLLSAWDRFRLQRTGC